MITLPGLGNVHVASVAEAAAVWREIWDCRSYDAGLNAAGEGGVIVDVGAHIGLFSLYACRHWAPRRVIAIEPADHSFAHLKANLATFPDVAQAMQVAVGPVELKRPFVYYPSAPGQSGFYTDPAMDDEVTRSYLTEQGVESEDIRDLLDGLHRGVMQSTDVLPLSEVLRRLGEPRIDLVKIDVERAELDVLHSLTLDTASIIRAFSIEIEDRNNRLSQICDWLAEHGFSVAVDADPLLSGSSFFIVNAFRPGVTDIWTC